MASPSNTDFINASNYVYLQTSTLPSALTPLMSNGAPVIGSSPSDGFYGQAFVNGAGQVIIAYEGTDPNVFSGFGRGSLSADVSILIGQTPAALGLAQQFAQSVIGIANQQGVTTDNIFVTGHSLGGAEAEAAASATGLGGVTFAAPGVPNYSNAGAQPNLTNYVEYGDSVANYASDTAYGQSLGLNGQDHVGQVVYIGNKSDANALTDSTYGLNNPVPGDDASGSFFFALGAALGGISLHGLDNYARDTGTTIQQLSANSPIGADAYAVLESIDASLGAPGKADLASATVVNGDQVNSTDFSITANSSGDYSITENQAVYNNQGLVSEVLGTATISIDPSTGDVQSASETSTTNYAVNVTVSQSTGDIVTSTLTNPDGTYEVANYNTDGSSVVTNYDAPSVPTMMRHLPPGSLALRVLKDHPAHAHGSHAERRRDGGRHERRP
jgi:hypothetical protein